MGHSASRASARADLRFPVECKVAGGSLRITLLAFNLSRGGIFLAGDANFDVGTNLDLSLTLPDEAAPILLRGTVIRRYNESEVHPAGIGVLLQEATGETRRRYEALVERLRAVKFVELG